MLENSLAEKLIEQVTKYTSYNVNIMNEQGVIMRAVIRSESGNFTKLHGRSCMEQRISWSLKMTMNTREY